MWGLKGTIHDNHRLILAVPVSPAAVILPPLLSPLPISPIRRTGATTSVLVACCTTKCTGTFCAAMILFGRQLQCMQLEHYQFRYIWERVVEPRGGLFVLVLCIYGLKRLMDTLQANILQSAFTTSPIIHSVWCLPTLPVKPLRCLSLLEYLSCQRSKS